MKATAAHRKGFAPVYGLVAFALIIFVGAIGCAKKCPVSQDPLRTFIGPELRLVESTDPQMKTLTNTNFIIMQFAVNYTGQVFRVENNEKYTTPAATFTYNVDPDQKLIQMQYTYASTSTGSGTATGSATQQSQSNVITYRYELSGNTFKMVDQGSGAYYRFVQFTGVVKPDEKCTF